MMNLVFEKISQTLAAGAKLDIGIGGSFLRLSECQLPVTISLLKEGRVIGTMNNMLAGDYVQGVDFDALWVVNGAASQVVGLQISAGGAGSNRVLGEVSVIDGGKARSLSGMAFSGGASQGAAAGQYSQVQLWNLAGSGKNLMVEQIVLAVGVGTSDGLGIWPTTTQLTDVGFVPSKRVGGAASVAAKIQRATAGVYPFSGVQLAAVTVPAGASVIYMQKEPIVVPPGYGLCIVNSSANIPGQSTFEFFEEPI